MCLNILMHPKERIGCPGNQTWALHNSSVLAWSLLLWRLPWPKATWGELIWLTHPDHSSSFNEVRKRTQTEEAGKWQEKLCVLLPCHLQQAPLCNSVQNLISYKSHLFFTFSSFFSFLSAFHSSYTNFQNSLLCETAMINLDCQLDLISNRLRDVPLAGSERTQERGLGGPERDWKGTSQKYFLRAGLPPEWGSPTYKAVWGNSVVCLPSLHAGDATIPFVLVLLSSFASIRSSGLQVWIKDQWLSQNIPGLQYQMGTAEASAFIDGAV